MIRTSSFLLLLIVLLTFSCNSNKDMKNDGTKEKAQVVTKIIKMPADTIYVKSPPDTIIIQSPPKIMQSPRVVGSRILFTHCRNTLHLDTLEGFSDIKIMTDKSRLSIFKSKSQPNYWDAIPKTTGTHTINYIVTLDSILYKWSETLRVIDPPKPTIELFINGKKTHGSSPIPKNSRIAIKIIPDPNFAAIMPKEANYSIRTIDVLAQLSLGPPTKINSVSVQGKSNINVVLGTRVRQMRPGTKVLLRMNDIYRKNDMRKLVPDKRFSEVEKTISFTVK